MTINVKDKRGVILIATYLVITALLVFSIIFVSRSINDKRLAIQQKNISWAFYLAESGLDRGLVWLRAQSSPPSGTAAFDPLGGTQALGEGAYSVSIDPDDGNAATYLKRYKIISVAAVSGISKTLNNEVQVDSYARYAYFTDTEHFRWYGWARIPVWFIGGDSIEGPTQSNTHFHMKGNPMFAGSVKSADNFTTFYNKGSYIDSSSFSNPPWDVPTFQQGLELGAEPFTMPSKALDLRVAAVRPNQGLQLQGPTTIVLNNNKMNVTNSQKGWNNEEVDLPANGALFVEGGDLTVSGTLNGRLTMGTNRNLVVANNITYADDPRTDDLESDDILGLIAERDVVISRNAPNDVEVDATVMALGNSFIVENWWAGSPKGTLTVYGGIIQRERGPVGTFNPSSGQKVTGYSKDYNYDSRLITAPPPFYPTTGDYVSLSWKE